MLPALDDASGNHSILYTPLALDGSTSHPYALNPNDVCEEDTKYKIEVLDITKQICDPWQA